MPRTITITVADYQRIERRLIDELAEARRLVVCLERRVSELEAELSTMREDRDQPLAAGVPV